MTRAKVTFLSPVTVVPGAAGDHYGFMMLQAPADPLQLTYDTQEQAVANRKALIGPETVTVPTSKLFNAIAKAITEAVEITQQKERMNAKVQAGGDAVVPHHVPE